MKKNILLSLVMLLSCGYANSADWRLVDTQPHNVELYIDMDSVKTGKTDNEYLYAAKFAVPGGVEKTMYLKTDAKANKLGIIRVEHTASSEYRPVRNLSNPHVFMKDVDDDNFLKSLQDCIIALYKNEELVMGDNGLFVVHKDTKDYNDKVLVYRSESNPTIIKDEFISYTNNNGSPNQAISDYLVAACKKIDSVWYPPQTSSDKRVIVKASINKKGMLDSYEITESSGDDRIDNSAIKALTNAQPYAKLPASESTYAMYFKFVFDRTTVGKKVVY